MKRTIIVSYRGPAAKPKPGQPAPGGVQAGLDRLYRHASPGQVIWVFMDGNELKMVAGSEAITLTVLDPQLVAAHYKGLCNAVLWPIAHDLYQYVSNAPQEPYRTFNEKVAWALASIIQPGDWLAVQDYQFAALPGLVRALCPSAGMSLFWHIPWPRTLPPQHIAVVQMAVEGLLGTNLLGFHTREYRRDFLRFVRKHLSGYSVKGYTVTHIPSGHICRVVVQPLGIDADYWKDLAAGPLAVPAMPDVPFLLSVERLDYTKGVFDRFQAIKTFFETYPQWLGKATFFQIAARTRSDIATFDRYWDDCEEWERYLNQRWGTADWKPLVWLKEGISPDKLAPLYRSAAATVVGPHRDGLNLVASEFVAASDPKSPGVLCLSPGAGVWHQLGDGSVELNPASLAQLAAAFDRALAMSTGEKNTRMAWLQNKVRQNPLSRWVRRFCQPARQSRKSNAAAAA